MTRIIFRTSGNSKNIWEGSIVPIQLEQPPYEVEVSARGSCFHLIIGRHAYGNYICIPNWNVGAELARMVDSFWNYEKLCQTSLKKVDACSVASALRELSRYVEL